MRFFKSVLLLFSVLFSVSGFAQTIDRVIAIVNDEAITLSEYQSRYKRELLETSKTTSEVPSTIDISVLRELIDERLQAQLALSQGINVSDIIK